MTASRFRKLHQGPGLLLLPNAWDAGSAKIIESVGATAIATSSAGVAWSRGYPDGDALPIDQLLTSVREIARTIRVPLTVDIEGGYSADAAAVGEVVAGVIDAGAVGINIEDGCAAPELLCAKIAAARQRALLSGIDLFINARTDVYLRDLAIGDAAIEEVVRRGQLYRAAGCDGIFVPGLSDTREIQAIAKAIDPLPLNIMAVPHLPSLAILQDSGVRRLSAGAAIALAAAASTTRLAAAFLAGSSETIFDNAAEYGDMNQLFSNTSE
jgi:2-methylisocitrate lyase-like PEP mutase family enzyme